MTTPAPTGNSDAPVATVPWGLSELGAYLLALAGLLNGYLGHDYGLSRNAQAISLLVGAIAIFVSNVSRAIKHHAAIHANAAVYMAQLKAVTDALSLQGGSAPPTIAQVTAGVSALNKAVVADTAVADKPKTRS